MSLAHRLPFTLNYVTARHDGSKRTSVSQTPLLATASNGSPETQWEFKQDWRPLTESASQVQLSASNTGETVTEVGFGLSIKDSAWKIKNYVLIPGAVYNGNRFKSKVLPYPPSILGPGPNGDPSKLVIMDLPRLETEDSTAPSHLDQLSIDAATPGIGIFFPARQKALLILTPQNNNQGNYGFEVIESEDRTLAEILITSPGIRHDKNFILRYKQTCGYSEPSLDRTVDLETGDSIVINFQLHWFDCENVQGLFDRLFEHRSACFAPKPLKKEIPFSATWYIIHKVQNASIWREQHGFYQTSILGQQEPQPAALLFQSGWCGGMISTYPMLQEGDAQSIERTLRSLDFYFTGLSPSGFFYPYYDGVHWGCDGHHEFPNPEQPWTLSRRNGDVLYFLVRHLMLLRERGMTNLIKTHWNDTLQLNADALIHQWERYGDLGQYVDINTGDLMIAGTTSGALVPAALLLAAEYFQKDKYADVASAIGEHYRKHDLKNGITTGGPGDAVQAPDSESVFQLVESFILLFEKTGFNKWRVAARDAVIQGASWALSYDYEFPKGSALAEIGAQSRGAFIANAQNKTGVPGICTLSGQGILRTYRATGDRRILEFLREICHTIPQYMGRKDKRIPCKIKAGNAYEEQPEGWICERVNITQWGEPIGELFAYSTWCSVSMMLIWCDIPGVYAEPDTGFALALDHVEAEWIGLGSTKQLLKIHNPTSFDGRVRVLVENASERRTPLPINAAARWPIVHVTANSTIHFNPATEAVHRV